MPPKGKEEKAKAAKKASTVEEKTFGMKNKKSAQNQRQINNMQQSTKPSHKEVRLAEPTAKEKKKADEERAKELAALFAVAIKQPKVPIGVDPKSMLCEFFRHGQCTKGFKCKYSHDLAVERKGAKIDLFTDQRDTQEEGMDDWDQETLEKAIAEKHGKEVATNATAIICKHFLESVEKKQYGWFWKCPTGAECKYRHALPPGYVLKSQMKELLEEEAANYKDAAELIEEERAKVDAKTPITESVFRSWHFKKMEQRRAKREEEEEDRRKKGLLSGREIFMQDGFTAHDDEGAADDMHLVRIDAEEEIRQMLEKAGQDAEAARLRCAGQAGASMNYDEAAEDEAPEDETAGPSGTTTTLKLDEDEEALFMEDDDDDDDGDMEEDLDALEEGIRQAHVGE